MPDSQYQIARKKRKTLPAPGQSTDPAVILRQDTQHIDPNAYTPEQMWDKKQKPEIQKT